MIDWLARPLEARGGPVVALDAIVVLGAPLAADGGLSRALAERVAGAVALWRAGGGRLVIATGGAVRGAAEAPAIAAALVAAGVGPVIVEAASRTTAENAALTARVMAAHGARSAWLVTQPFHSRRAVRLFRRAGIDARAWHLADSVQYREPVRALRWVVREYAAWAAMLLRRR